MSASRDRRSSPEPSSSTSPASYVYCKPTVLQTDGYAYGKTNLEGAGEDSVSVTRVASGRWAELPEIVCPCLRRDVQGRTVEAEEAASGIGTYVGSYVCVARLHPGSAKVWSYGVVTDYTWNGRGLVHVCFGADSSSIEFNTSELQVLPLPVYTLRRCAGVPVLTLMGAEMRSRHGAVLDHFNGTGCRASRNSTSILRKVGAAPVGETTMIPVFDFSRCCVQSTSLKYVLDFSYYHGNSRRRPQSVILGATILDEPQRATATATQVQETLGAVEEEVTGQAAAQTTPAPCTPSAARTEFLPGQLSDSDDSDGEEADPAPLQEVTLLPSAERKRPLEVAMTDSGETASLKLLKRSYSDNPSMLRSIDQLIALRVSTVSAGAVSDVIGPTISSSGKSKQQFQPSVLQRSIHRHLVTGTYALMDAQLLLETLQVQHLLFAFLLHPAILRALFSWEFGLRGLSVMHFAPVTESFRRDYAASHDMADFSRAAVLPAARNPTELGCIIDALDGLDSVVSRVYLPYVSELVMAARKMVVRLKSQEGFSNHVARKELVYWINERFEQFRGFLALNRTEEALSVCAQFSTADPSFVRVTQIITAASIAELRQLQQTQPMAKQPPAPGPQNTKHLKAKPPASDDRPPVPQAVLTALPKLNGKSLCMRYLSNLPCPSRLDRCYARRRGHFNPGSLPAIVYDFIRDTYGGLKKEFSAVTREPTEQ